MSLNEHAHIKSKKKKKNRGDHPPFMSKELSKAIMNRPKLRNRYTKWPSCENFLVFKKQNNFCYNFSKKIKRNYFTKISSKRVTGNKDFWNAVKPFLTPKGFLHNDDIAINFDNRNYGTKFGEINKIMIKHLNPKKATGLSDKTSVKIVKLG